MSNRARRRSAQDSDKEVRIELTPMIDVTFLILIFFMCTLQFRTLEGTLSAFLPTDRGLGGEPETVEFEKARLVLRVHAEDQTMPSRLRRVQVFTGASRAPLGVLQAGALRCEPADLWALVRGYTDRVLAADATAGAILEARPDVPHAAAVLALDKLRGAGFEAVSFAGIPPRLIGDLHAGKIK